MDAIQFRRVVAYNGERNTTIEVFTNNLTWKTSTVAGLFRRRWDTETFFKLPEQNINVKPFVGTSPNGVKSQLFVTLTYLLLELLRRVKAKEALALSNFVEKIRICLPFYLPLDCVINGIRPCAQRAGPTQTSMEFEGQGNFF